MSRNSDKSVKHISAKFEINSNLLNFSMFFRSVSSYEFFMGLVCNTVQQNAKMLVCWIKFRCYPQMNFFSEITLAHFNGGFYGYLL